MHLDNIERKRVNTKKKAHSDDNNSNNTETEQKCKNASTNLWWISFCTNDQIAAKVDGIFEQQIVWSSFFLIFFYFVTSSFQLRFCNAIFCCCCCCYSFQFIFAQYQNEIDFAHDLMFDGNETKENIAISNRERKKKNNEFRRIF